MSRLTLGSLFDGSGGFPLGGMLCGIEPIWASEIEPFPIRVTTKRIPHMLHLGDIRKIHGGRIPPVDIITAGFCCQDLSVAGKQAGLRGERSGLFFQIPRIISEMRTATNGAYPRFAVLENVPGMYSSNKGHDFLEVLNELAKIKDKTVSLPMPEKGKWLLAGEIVADGYSIAWRTLDAQYWGVAQRRRRCYIVVDFDGERAGEILFKPEAAAWHPPQVCLPWQDTAGGASFGIDSRDAIAFEPGALVRLGSRAWSEVASTLRADMGDNRLAVAIPINTQNALRNPDTSKRTSLGIGEDGEPANTLSVSHCHAVAIEHHPNDSRVKVSEKGTVQALTGRMGTGGGNVPLVVADDSEMRGNKDACGNAPIIPYCLCSYTSFSMLSDNPHVGVYEAETSRTLLTDCCRPDNKQGGIAVVCIEGNGTRPSHKGSGYRGDVSFTLNSVEQHGVAFCMTTGCFAQVCKEKSPTLTARDYKDAHVVAKEDGERVGVVDHWCDEYKVSEVSGTLTTDHNKNTRVVENRYIVRRLTPQECAMLQGFPFNWCYGLETEEPTDEDMAFWREVFEAHRLSVGKSNKPKSRNQIIKWLKNPHSDSAEYKMWGNGVALPCVVYVLGGIVQNATHR